MKTPTLDEFIEHGSIRLQMMGLNPEMYKRSLIATYLKWDDNDWHTLGKSSRKIKNWKSTLTNTCMYLRAEKIEVIAAKEVQVKSKLSRYE